eukprot:SAG22_NODE_48_length_24654_cov_4.406394_18_plen_167_part_00
MCSPIPAPGDIIPVWMNRHGVLNWASSASACIGHSCAGPRCDPLDMFASTAPGPSVCSSRNGWVPLIASCSAVSIAPPARGTAGAEMPGVAGEPPAAAPAAVIGGGGGRLRASPFASDAHTVPRRRRLLGSSSYGAGCWQHGHVVMVLAVAVAGSMVSARARGWKF